MTDNDNARDIHAEKDLIGKGGSIRGDHLNEASEGP